MCVLLLAFVGFFAEQCVVFYEKNAKDKHYLNIIVLVAVPGGGGGNGEGDGG